MKNINSRHALLQGKVPGCEVARADPVPGSDLFLVGGGEVDEADVGRLPQLPHHRVGWDSVVPERNLTVRER